MQGRPCDCSSCTATSRSPQTPTKAAADQRYAPPGPVRGDTIDCVSEFSGIGALEHGLQASSHFLMILLFPHTPPLIPH